LASLDPDFSPYFASAAAEERQATDRASFDERFASSFGRRVSSFDQLFASSFGDRVSSFDQRFSFMAEAAPDMAAHSIEDLRRSPELQVGPDSVLRPEPAKRQ